MSQSSDETHVRTLVDDWANAVRAHDVAGAIAHHADDIVMFDAPVPLQAHGIDEYRKTWELFFANSPGGPGSFEVTELHISAGETVAYCHAILRILDSKARLTIGMRKVNGQWLFAHEHHSYPIELESE